MTSLDEPSDVVNSDTSTDVETEQASPQKQNSKESTPPGTPSSVNGKISSANSRPTSSPPDVVTSTKKDRGSRKSSRRTMEFESLILVCRLYAKLVRALKDENSFLSKLSKSTKPLQRGSLKLGVESHSASYKWNKNNRSYDSGPTSLQFEPVGQRSVPFGSLEVLENTDTVSESRVRPGSCRLYDISKKCSTGAQNARELEKQILDLLQQEPLRDIFGVSPDNITQQSRPLCNLRRSSSCIQSSHNRKETLQSFRETFGGQISSDIQDLDYKYSPSCKDHFAQDANQCPYQMLSQSNQVEVEKLRQMVQMLNARITKMSNAKIRAELLLKETQQKMILMEKTVERQSLMHASGLSGEEISGPLKSPRQSMSSESIHRKVSLQAWNDTTSEYLLRNKLEMSREETELLRQHVDLLLRMRQEDLKVYESTVDRFRLTFSSGRQW